MEQKHYEDLAKQVTEKEEIIKKHKEKMAKYRMNKHKKTVKANEQKYKEAERYKYNIIFFNFLCRCIDTIRILQEML